MSPIKSFATEKEINHELIEFEKVLTKSEKAPYKGVLVPEDNYRYYQSQDAQDQILEKSLQECIDSKSELNPLLPFAGGAVVGFLGTLLLFSLIHH